MLPFAYLSPTYSPTFITQKGELGKSMFHLGVILPLLGECTLPFGLITVRGALLFVSVMYFFNICIA